VATTLEVLYGGQNCELQWCFLVAKTLKVRFGGQTLEVLFGGQTIKGVF